MPAVVLNRSFFAWGPAARREREEHSYRWAHEPERAAWVGEERLDRTPAAEEGTGLSELVHDLRHQLTHAELEFEAGEPGRAREVLAELRGSCEEALGLRAPRALDLVALCSGEARTAARAHQGRELQTSLPRECSLACSEAALRRLLANLLANALRATGAHDAVCFALQCEPDGGARLTIRDRGPGIERAAIDRLLGSRTSGNGSSGLGTLSVLACARALRATIVVRSEPGSGTEFELRLPG
jgi:signal transduction histidine kinase